MELTRRLAKRLQRALKKLGYYGGRVNGVWPEESEGALGAFEQFNIFFRNPTVIDGGTLFIDSPLADYILTGKRRGVLVRNPAV